MAAAASSSAVEVEMTTYDPIEDGEADIATNASGDKMKVQARGRQPLQKVWLWTGSNDSKEAGKKSRAPASSSSTTTIQYKAETDAPKVGGMPPSLPKGDELESHVAAIEYLEVGLVIGDEPDRFMRKGLSRDKDEEAARKTRGAQDREKSAMRAFIPVTDFIAEQARFYVGVKPTSGRLIPRVIRDRCIFFYSEFWQGMPEKANVGVRQSHFNQTAKFHAARDKHAVDRSTAPVATDFVQKWTSSNQFTVASAESLASTLALHYTHFLQSGDRTHLRDMLQAINNAAPDLKVGPYTVTDGVLAFLNFKKRLTDEEAAQFARELKTAVPTMPNLEIEHTKAVRSIVMENNWASELPMNGLTFFMELCHNKFQVTFDPEVQKTEVESALALVKIHNRHQVARTTSNTSNITPGNHHLVLSLVRDTVRTLCTFVEDSSKGLAEQHGGLLKHGSLKDMMNQISNAMDVPNQQNLWEQLSAMHAFQHVGQNDHVVVKLKMLDALLEKTLAGVSQN